MFKNYRTRLTLNALERRENPTQFLDTGEPATIAIVKADVISDPRELLEEAIYLGPEWVTEDSREADEAALEQELANQEARGMTFTSMGCFCGKRIVVDETKIKFGPDNAQLMDGDRV